MAVIRIDRQRRAVGESEAAMAAYLVQREKAELDAIRRARMRRMAKDRRTWGLITLVACAITALGTTAVLRADKAVPLSPAPAAVQATPTAQAQTTTAPATAQTPIAVAPTAPAAPAVLTLAPAPGAAAQFPPLPSGVAQRAATPPVKSPPSPPPPAAASSRPAPPASKGFVSFAQNVPAKAPSQAPSPPQVASPVTPASKPAAPVQAPMAQPADLPAQPAPTTAAGPNFTVVGMPTDEVVLVKIDGETTVRPVRLGQKLPTGETLLMINIGEGRIRTDQRSVIVPKR